ncbi:Transposase, Ptta/En/Spm, plant [Corchorus olitorius]|uniref:Transposase, Ptta/En/Spm, plant n=1 Tax=Corchorus olitorius TaxID=93759 RepID=A0A1R3K908_9ROSI|nr:Transposase, Ptta/En/Spm, plant [Corchorus olitorius]
MATIYKGYNVNGFKFHTQEYGQHKRTMNSGVWVKGSTYNDYERDYYGLLETSANRGESNVNAENRGTDAPPSEVPIVNEVPSVNEVPIVNPSIEGSEILRDGDELNDRVAETDQATNFPTTRTRQKSRGRNRCKPVPSDPSKRTELHILDNTDFKENHVAQDITSMVKDRFNAYYPTFTKFPEGVKSTLWQEFKDKYCWDNNIEQAVYDIWYAKADKGFKDGVSRARISACRKAGIDPFDTTADHTKLKYFRIDWIPAPVWNEFVDKLWSTKEFLEKAARASRSRNTQKEGGITKHTAGPRSFAKWKDDLAKESGKTPTFKEVFNKTHTRRKGQEGDFVDPKSKAVFDKYIVALKEKHGDAADEVVFDPVAYTNAVNDRNRSHLYGFGGLQKETDILGESSTRSSTFPTTAPTQIPEEMKQLFRQWATEELPGMMTTLLPSVLSSLGYHPLDGASRDNIIDPSSSLGREVEHSRQNDIERNESSSDGGNDDDMGELDNLS